MSVLIHSSVAMEGFVGMGRGAFKEEEEDGRSEESSSIGEVESSGSLSPSSEGGGDEDEEIMSELRDEDSLGSLADLEDSLPIKRGLSNYFNGKAKSFSSLADIVTAPTTASDLAKQEHPFNKRRRVLMAAKKKAAWPRRASCSSLSTLPLPSLLASELRVLEEEEDEEEDMASSKGSPRLPPLPIIHGKGLKSFRSPRSFSLTDLQQHDEIS